MASESPSAAAGVALSLRSSISHESSPMLLRRLSMEEDYFYNELMTRRPSQPPTYETAIAQERRKSKQAERLPSFSEAVPTPTQSNKSHSKSSSSSPTRSSKEEKRAAKAAKRKQAVKKNKLPRAPAIPSHDMINFSQDALPFYYCDIHNEGVFQMKVEIIDAVRPAKDRSWLPVYVELHGTALNIYTIRKDWGFGKSRRVNEDMKPDNPPWMKKGELDRTYSLQHADVGIAADYRKRRYVIRVRAGSDQFLLSCIELGNFIGWLESFFAALDVAAPIDDRDFPRDQSIPRVQRSRWLRGQFNARAERALRGSTGGTPLDRIPEDPVSAATDAAATPVPVEVILARPEPPASPTDTTSPLLARADTLDRAAALVDAPPSPDATTQRAQGRLSSSSYPSSNLDAETGKWAPRHRWTSTHDMIYAKLCYAVLLFKSPRKSNYIVLKGKQWIVDWKTGNMQRVLPPGYDEPSFFGPWQIVMTENSRI